MTNHCPICGSGEVFPFFFCERVPVLNNVLCKTSEQAHDIATGVLDFYACGYCGFVWNAAFDSERVQYDTCYENNQSISPAFRRHLQEVVDCIRCLMQESPFSVMEVGCGQGYFLEMLQENLQNDLLRGIGFDPALRAKTRRGNIDFIPKFAEKNLIPSEFVSPLLLLSRHVIEHIDRPLSFLRSLRELTPHVSAAVLETPSVEWIIENGAYFDFYYEHCSIFTPFALSILFHEAGFHEAKVFRLFGGQYLLGTALMNGREDAAPQHGNYGNFYKSFADCYHNFRAQWINQMKDLNSWGKRVALWGGSSKGVMFANMLGENSGILSAIDINPQKQRCYLPLSGLPVISPQEAKNDGIDTVIIMNLNYTEEIHALCAGMNFFPRFISAQK